MPYSKCHRLTHIKTCFSFFCNFCIHFLNIIFCQGEITVQIDRKESLNNKHTNVKVYRSLKYRSLNGGNFCSNRRNVVKMSEEICQLINIRRLNVVHIYN